MRSFTIGIDARMFSDTFTGIGRCNFEITQRFFQQTDLPYKWVIFMNDPEYSRFKDTFPPHVRAVCVNAKHYSISEQTSFLFHLYKAKCDLLHFTHFNRPLLYRKPFIVTIHDTTISFYPGKKMNKWFHKLAYKKVIQSSVTNAKKVITVSRNTQNDVENLFHIPSQRIQTIYNGISHDFKPASPLLHEAVKQKYGIPDTFLFYAGVWREHKNLVKLLHAFRRLVDIIEAPTGPRYLKNIKLVLTGKPDFYYQEIPQTIHRLKLQNRVITPGLVPAEDLQYLYSAADVFVFPSLYEGFGIPPLEAMQSHTPVCASRISCIPEICGDAVAYFDPHDEKDMARVILQVLTQEELRKSLIEKGIKRLHSFSWDKTTQEILKIYAETLQ